MLDPYDFGPDPRRPVPLSTAQIAAMVARLKADLPFVRALTDGATSAKMPDALLGLIGSLQFDYVLGEFSGADATHTPEYLITRRTALAWAFRAWQRRRA